MPRCGVPRYRRAIDGSRRAGEPFPDGRDLDHGDLGNPEGIQALEGAYSRNRRGGRGLAAGRAGDHRPSGVFAAREPAGEKSRAGSKGCALCCPHGLGVAAGAGEEDGRRGRPGFGPSAVRASLHASRWNRMRFRRASGGHGTCCHGGGGGGMEGGQRRQGGAGAAGVAAVRGGAIVAGFSRGCGTYRAARPAVCAACRSAGRGAGERGGGRLEGSGGSH